MSADTSHVGGSTSEGPGSASPPQDKAPGPRSSGSSSPEEPGDGSPASPSPLDDDGSIVTLAQVDAVHVIPPEVEDPVRLDFSPAVLDGPMRPNGFIGPTLDAVAGGPSAVVGRSEVPRSSRTISGVDLRSLRHQVLADKYRIETPIARGGMGWVFLATQLPLGREVAIKVLLPQPGDTAFRERFLLEASTCSKLSHPNIVTVHDYGETPQGDLYMAMEYLRGQSLSRTLAREGRLEPARAARIILQIARALRAAHRAGVVHRDLKPSNVMLLEDDDGVEGYDFVKVVDFGLVRLYQPAADVDALRLTHAGMLLGSPRYMAPEQIRNRDVDPRTDIYALGVIFFMILTGRPPFDGDNPTDILTQHLRDAPPRMVEVAPDLVVPAELEAVVGRCILKDPRERYPNVDALIADLKAVVGGFTDDRSLPSLGLTTVSKVFGMPELHRLEASSGTGAGRPLTAWPEGSEPELSRRLQAAEPPPISRLWGLAIVLAAVVGSLAFWAVVLG